LLPTLLQPALPQVSVVQSLPSLQARLLAALSQPVAVSQLSMVQATPSSQSASLGEFWQSPLLQRSSEILRHITDKSNGRLPVIASGGIFSGADALEKLSTGAVLVQIWTGFVYEGPMAAARICKTILRST
jgi:dihydroorotate dehydrogenase